MNCNVLKNSFDVIPYCHYFIIYNGVYELSDSVPVGDPRIEEAKKKGKLISEITNANIHYFDDIGFLQCKKCGWTP